MKKLINALRQIAVLALLCLSMSVAAQTTAQMAVHIVERGETLNSIAQKYGVTEQQILDINPDAAQFIYVGMELNIPTASKTPPVTIKNETSGESVISGGYTQYSETRDESTLYSADVSSSYKESWTHLGITYVTDFDNFDKGFYAFYFEGVGQSGFGGYFLLGTNWGLCKPAEMLARLGPDYAVAIQDNIHLSFPLCFNMTTFETVKEVKEYKNSSTTTKDFKIAYGLSITPKISFKVDRVNLGFGLDINHFFEKKVKSTYLGVTQEQKYYGKTNLGLVLSVGF